jgi:hypothetical protein
MIKAFKFRAQAIFSFFEKTAPLIHKIWVRKIFSIILYYKYPNKLYIHKKLDTNSCFAKLRADSYLFSFFLYTLYSIYIYINLWLELDNLPL